MRNILKSLLITGLSLSLLGVDAGKKTSSGGGVVSPDFFPNYSLQSCNSNTPYSLPSYATEYPNTSCPNPAGMLVIDPYRYGLLINTGNEADSNGSSYNTGTVDDVTDFIKTTGLSTAAQTLTVATPGSSAKNSTSFGFTSLGTNTADKFFCRDVDGNSPYLFAPADSNGNCGSGTCGNALVSQMQSTLVARKNWKSLCTAADVPFGGCTGPGTGNVYRYYPFSINSVNMCNNTNNSFGVPEGLPETLADGDTFMKAFVDGIHPSPYMQAYLAQLIQDYTYEMAYIPRVNMIPNGTQELNTANGSAQDCVLGSPTTGTSAVSAGTVFTSVLDPVQIYSVRLAVYGRACQLVGGAAWDYFRSPGSGFISVVPNRVYVIIGAIKANGGSAHLQVIDGTGAVIDPGATQSVIAAWSPRGGIDYDPLTYSATGWNGLTPSLDFPANRSVLFTPFIMKITIPATVTQIALKASRGNSTAQMMIDELWMYPAIHQNMTMNKLFPDGLQSWALQGDSRSTLTTGSLDGSSQYANMLGNQEYGYDTGTWVRPTMHFPNNFALNYSKGIGGWTIFQELALSEPFGFIRAKKPKFAFIFLGYNDIVASKRSIDTVIKDMQKAREIISSYGSIPVWILEPPVRGSIGTGTTPGTNDCTITSGAAPDYSGRTGNCATAVLSFNRRILHDGFAF